MKPTTITLSARCLSRAWLAVSRAAATAGNVDSPYWRAMRIELHAAGVRLIALDGYLAAWCWVPSWALMGPVPFPAGDDTPEAPIKRAPLRAVTVRDSDGRVADLMDYLKSATGAKDSLDQPVEVDLAAMLDPEPGSLFPEWNVPAARFELLTRERVIAPLIEGEWANWRAIASRSMDGEPGAIRRTISTDNLKRLTQISGHVAGSSIILDMTNGSEGASVLWSIGLSSTLHHTPTGVVTQTRDGEPERAADAPTVDEVEARRRRKGNTNT